MHEVFLKAQIYLQVAEQDNAEAQYWVSAMYLKEMGVTEDNDLALDC